MRPQDVYRLPPVPGTEVKYVPPTDAEMRQWEKNRIQQQAIKFKSQQTCKLFRCLHCWKLILPDEDVIEKGDGYIHRVHKQK